jgi:hypothetical protein
MKNPSPKTSLATFAFIAGLGILFMATSPFAEFLVYQKLVVPGNAAETVKNITENKSLYMEGMFAYLFNFICDVVVAWALYFLLNPVNESLSLLTAWFQLVYAVISLVALINLFTVFQLLTNTDYLTILQPNQLRTQVMLSLHAFRTGWLFGYFFFGGHLVLLGYLVFKSGYIPWILGVLLAIAGLGYLINTLQPFLWPGANMGFIMVTYFGELIFMFWLLFRGLRIKTTN